MALGPSILDAAMLLQPLRSKKPTTGTRPYTTFDANTFRDFRSQPIGPRIQPVQVRLRELAVYPHSYIRHFPEVTQMVKARK